MQENNARWFPLAIYSSIGTTNLTAGAGNDTLYGSMRRFFIQILCAAVLFTSRSATADIDPKGIPDDFKKNFPVSIVASVSVQKKIGKLSPADLKRINEAISTGSNFMQHYLDGYWCGNYPDWELIMDKVVDTEGIRSSCDNIKYPKRTDSVYTYQVVREMCQQVSLHDFAFENGEVSLTYQMTILGTLSYTPQDVNLFTTENSGRKMQIVVFINSQNKAHKFLPEDWGRQLIYLSSLFDLKGTYYFHGIAPPAGTSPTPVGVRNMKIARQIERQAARVCK